MNADTLTFEEKHAAIIAELDRLRADTRMAHRFLAAVNGDARVTMPDGTLQRVPIEVAG